MQLNWNRSDQSDISIIHMCTVIEELELTWCHHYAESYNYPKPFFTYNGPPKDQSQDWMGHHFHMEYMQVNVV